MVEFLGKVHPERPPITLRIPVAKISFEGERVEEIEFRTHIEASQISCKVLPTPKSFTLEGLRNAARDVVQAQLDFLGFCNNYAYVCELTSAIDGDGKEQLLSS